VTAVFLIAPLAILSHETSKNTQLVVVSVCILILSFLVSLFLKTTSFEMMAVAAAYAAVLSVFVSNAQVSA
jgi:Ca2+/Na+ antiporter